MRVLAAAAIVALALTLLVGGCGAFPAPPRVYACATVDTPPEVVADSHCPADRGSTASLRESGTDRQVRWYSAPESDITEDDERPVIGEELDGDFWDPRDQYDVDEHHASTTKPKATRAPKPTRR